MNALVGAGYAHMAANDPTAAGDAFHRALAIVPRSGRALLGLQHAALQVGSVAECASLASKVNEAIVELTKGGRVAEATALEAATEAAKGNISAACSVLERLLEHAPSGQVGWMIPIDFALAGLRDDSSFEAVLSLLSARAR